MSDGLVDAESLHQSTKHLGEPIQIEHVYHAEQYEAQFAPFPFELWVGLPERHKPIHHIILALPEDHVVEEARTKQEECQRHDNAIEHGK